MFHGWRTTLYQKSLNEGRVAAVSIGLLIAGFVVSMGIATLKEATGESWEVKEQRELDALLGSSKRPMRALADWLVGYTYQADWFDEDEGGKDAVASVKDYHAGRAVMGVKLREEIARHVSPQDQQALFEDFVIAFLAFKSDEGREPWKRVESAALRLPPAEFANGFLGCLLVAADKPMEAMRAFQREGEFADAEGARACALDLALHQGSVTELREMLTKPGYRAAMSPSLEFKAGDLLGDLVMHWRGLIRMECSMARVDYLLVAVLAALLWYAIFQRFLREVEHRWLWALPMFLAGIGSVAITFALIKQQESLGLVRSDVFPRDLLFFIAGVGLREELSKLAAFALFLPWLLRRRSASAAMLAGAFVGLGFAFEENLSYYVGGGFGVVIGRLLTANFMHAAMTSMCGYALYELVRTRFGSAEKSLITFFGVVLAHGIYDWAPSAGMAMPVLSGGGLVSFMVLVFLAQRFFDDLGTYVVPRRGLVALVALFLLGVSGLIALSMVSAAIAASAGNAIPSVADVGADAARLVPVAVMYVRRFHHG